MRFSGIFITLTVSVKAFALVLGPYNNTCFDMTKGSCVGSDPADVAKATTAITNACNKVTACTPGQKGHGRGTVTGTILSFPYTATLYVGDQCGGVQTWSTAACVDLFNQFVDTRCEAYFPAGPDKFVLGYVHAPCDQSLVSFNYGG